MELDIWLCPYEEDHYEHIAVCVDDLLIASKDPKQIIDALTNKHSFKLKGTGPISHHLGCDFSRNGDGTLRFAPKKHIETMVNCYCNIFGTKPKLTYSSPLEKGNYPELDTSEYLDACAAMSIYHRCSSMGYLFRKT